MINIKLYGPWLGSVGHFTALAIIILEIVLVSASRVAGITVASIISGYLSLPYSNRSSLPRIAVRCETRSEAAVTLPCHGCRSLVSDLDDCRPSIVEKSYPFNQPSIQPTCIASKGQPRKFLSQRNPITAFNQPHWKKRRRRRSSKTNIALYVSRILRPSHHLSSHLAPVDIIINPLVHLAANHHIIAPDQVQPMFDLRARLRVVWCADNALDGVQQNKVRQLIGREKRAHERSAVHGQDEDLFYTIQRQLIKPISRRVP